MPFGDGTGPMGLGPMTGRGAGFCAGFGSPGFANPVPGRWFGGQWGASYGYPYSPSIWPSWSRWGWGFGRGWGRGRGWRRRGLYWSLWW